MFLVRAGAAMSGVELFTLGSLAVTIGDVAMGVGVLGTALSATSQVQQGNYAQQTGQYNQQVYQRQAAITTQNTAAQEEAQRRDAARRAGSNRAAVGASGIDLTGSPLDVLEANAQQEELDALTIRWNGRNQADSLDAQGSLAAAAGSNQQQASYIGAGSTLLLGGSRILSYGNAPKRA